MTNADYYVNVYRDGSTGSPWRSRSYVDEMAIERRIGIWHVRLKSDRR